MELSEENCNDLLSSILQRYGYDFTGYSRASIFRRIIRFAELQKLGSVFDLKLRLLNDAHFFSSFVHEVTVNVTEMFRDTGFFRSLKEEVYPYLSTYPFIKIWHAGCSTGEEVYSNAIMLTESGLYNRSRIYATDINQEVLDDAKQAAYPLSLMKEYADAYARSGGAKSFENYYTLENTRARLDPVLRKNVIFSPHNLVTDGSFNEFNLIICRNVLIYFGKELQERVFQLFYESLAPFGYLALGSKENLFMSTLKDKFEVVDRKEKIYRKIS